MECAFPGFDEKLQKILPYRAKFLILTGGNEHRASSALAQRKRAVSLAL
ncbi:MAG: hypothetical protein FWG56_12665 [Desulfovibrionaceae bacterium]|jgi:hypothetical protein|nr:hypothetical protein [Desulfovibrionaceae bacterium]